MRLPEGKKQSQFFETRGVRKFISKLWAILKDTKLNGDIISWNDDGTKVYIHDVHKMPIVMRRYFKSSIYESMARQFSFYAFERGGSQKGLHYWHHHKFRRDNPSCVCTMRRKGSSNTSKHTVEHVSPAVVKAPQWTVERGHIVDAYVYRLLSANLANEQGFCTPEHTSNETCVDKLSDGDLTETDQSNLTESRTNHSLVQPHIERGWSLPRDVEFFEIAKVGQQILDNGFDKTVRAYHSSKVLSQKDAKCAATFVSKILA